MKLTPAALPGDTTPGIIAGRCPHCGTGAHVRPCKSPPDPIWYEHGRRLGEQLVAATIFALAERDGTVSPCPPPEGS
jgi:hypothetical protein